MTETAKISDAEQAARVPGLEAKIAATDAELVQVCGKLRSLEARAATRASEEQLQSKILALEKMLLDKDAEVRAARLQVQEKEDALNQARVAASAASSPFARRRRRPMQQNPISASSRGGSRGGLLRGAKTHRRLAAIRAARRHCPGTLSRSLQGSLHGTRAAKKNLN